MPSLLGPCPGVIRDSKVGSRLGRSRDMGALSFSQRSIPSEDTSGVRLVSHHHLVSFLLSPKDHHFQSTCPQEQPSFFSNVSRSTGVDASEGTQPWQRWGTHRAGSPSWFLHLQLSPFFSYTSRKKKVETGSSLISKS